MPHHAAEENPHLLEEQFSEIPKAPYETATNPAYDTVAAVYVPDGDRIVRNWTVTRGSAQEAIHSAERAMKHHNRILALKTYGSIAGMAFALALVFYFAGLRETPYFTLRTTLSMSAALAAVVVIANLVHPFLFVGQKQRYPRVEGIPITNPQLAKLLFEHLTGDERTALFQARQEGDLVAQKALVLLSAQLRKRSDDEFAQRQEKLKQQRKQTDDEAFAKAKEILHGLDHPNQNPQEAPS